MSIIYERPSYTNFLIPLYMTIFKLPQFHNTDAHIGNTSCYLRQKHAMDSNIVYKYCSHILVNPNTVGLCYILCTFIFTHIYP